MTRKRRRLYTVVAGMAVLGVAAALVLTALEDNILFFYSPSDVVAKKPPPDRRFRLGGIVQPDSVRRHEDGVTIGFRVTDMTHTLPVAFKGVLPDLFREGQGVVTEGRMGADGVFRADDVLAKHDETYMPKEVAEALKKSGHWKGKTAP